MEPESQLAIDALVQEQNDDIILDAIKASALTQLTDRETCASHDEAQGEDGEKYIEECVLDFVNDLKEGYGQNEEELVAELVEQIVEAEEPVDEVMDEVYESESESE